MGSKKNNENERMRRHYADACGARKRQLRRTRGVKAKTGSACVQTDGALPPLGCRPSGALRGPCIVSSFPRSVAIIIPIKPLQLD